VFTSVILARPLMSSDTELNSSGVISRNSLLSSRRENGDNEGGAVII